MKKICKVELWKAMHNHYFILSIIIGTLIVVFNVFESSRTANEIITATLISQENGMPLKGFAGASLFIQWIATNGIHFGSIYFAQIWPVLAGLPFAWSYTQEASTGSICQYVSRSGKWQYFNAKYLSVYIVGGLSTTYPVIFDLMINALFCPAEKLFFWNALSGVQNAHFLASLFNTHPWLFAMIWSVVVFFIGGSSAALCFIIGSKIRFGVAVTFVPFIMVYCLGMIGETVTHIIATTLVLNPLRLVMAIPMGYNPAWLLLSVICSFTILSYTAGYWWVIKNDIL